MAKEKHENLSIEIFKARKKKNLMMLRILFVVALIGFFLFLYSYINKNEFNLAYMILTGAAVGGVIEVIIKVIKINKEIARR